MLLQNYLSFCSDPNVFTFQLVNIAGHEVRALRLSFVGELGWELHIPNDGAVDVHKAVMDAGKQYGIVNAGYRSIDSLSIEKGRMAFFSEESSKYTCDSCIENNVCQTFEILHSSKQIIDN